MLERIEMSQDGTVSVVASGSEAIPELNITLSGDKKEIF
jgi:hypothetical protein